MGNQLGNYILNVRLLITDRFDKEVSSLGSLQGKQIQTSQANGKWLWLSW